MALHPDPDQPGLWVNDDVKPGAPGVYALIIGISRYDHLLGGAKPVVETYGLGQLAVSALTALRFFGWLRSDYHLNGWPLARVRLLLSPLKKGVGEWASDELENCDPNIVAHATEATFANCKNAIADWYGEMKELKPPTKGRSLLFFSGHGMQIAKANQLLLPSDYGRPRGSLDEAIRTQNLFECLSSLATVPSHVVLLDACRNDIAKLRKVTGTNVIDESGSSGDPLLELRVLRATAYGLRAFQPKTKGGMSLFGQALLDGLSAKPNPVLGEAPIELSARGKVKTVEINNLQVYMNGRINALIKAANESVIQVVRADDSQSAAGTIYMTELEAAATADVSASEDTKKVEEVTIGLPFPKPGHHFDRVGNFEAFTIEKRQRSKPAQKPKQKAARPGAWFEKRYSEQKRSLPSSAHPDRLRELFGSEAFTLPWLDNMRVTGLSTKRSLDHQGVELVSAAQTEDKGDLHGIQIHVRLTPNAPDPIGHALTITDFSGCRFCTILPSDRRTRSFQIEIDRINGSYIRFATYLSPLNEGMSSDLAAAWDKMRALTAPAAAKVLEKSWSGPEMASLSQVGERALARKMVSPLAATVAAALLLRANRLDLMRDWTRNVANWFPSIPDGVVFWTEQCRREGHGKLGNDMTAWFVRELSNRSLPFTSDALGIAANFLSDIERKRISADASTRRAAARLKERIGAAMLYFRDDGLFCTYAAVPGDWHPTAVLGPRTAKRGGQTPAPSTRHSPQRSRDN